MSKIKIDDLVVVDGHQYKVIGLGIERDDGTVYAHLASTSVKLKQRNGLVPRQMCTFIPINNESGGN